MEIAPVHLLLFAFIVNLCDFDLHFVPVILDGAAELGEIKLEAIHVAVACKINIVNIAEIVDALNQRTIIQRRCWFSG